jgi:hypothetical protein
MTIETELPAVKVKADQIDRVGKAIALNRMKFGLPASITETEDFALAFEKTWAGTSPTDERQRAAYRKDASVAISALTLKDDPGNGAETRAAALEEAAKLIQATADEHSTKGRDLRGGYSDRRFYAVMGARLNESAAAIRALIPEREG